MLTAFSVHGGFGLKITCRGDLNVDCHHTIEDVGIWSKKPIPDVYKRQVFAVRRKSM